MADIKLKDPTDVYTTYSGVNLIKVPQATSGTSSFICGDNSTAVAGDMLEGKIAYNAQGTVVGTIPTYNYTFWLTT